MNEIELLAPAGSYEGFEAAIHAGADAVYIGGNAFGARAYAKNFQPEEVLQAIDTAHLYEKKLYLTVNTLLKNPEMKRQLYDYLKEYYSAGLDAVIVQDFGVFSFIRDTFPDMHIHASTQMTVTGPNGMKFLENHGASRVVTARELSLDEIHRMHEASPIEIESFVHGALCYSYSGQCLMSSMLGGRSGNRGRCAQPCRLTYRAGKQELCPLSLKDICTIEILPQIIQAGVTSLKIEGRMKQPAYTAGVTAMYRKYLDLYLQSQTQDYHVLEQDKKYLLDLFNRGGSCSGYYQMQNGPSMMAFSNDKKTGEVHLDVKKEKVKIQGNLTLSPGNPVILSGSYKEASVTVSKGEVQTAQNQPMEELRVRQQMEKLGNTEFIWDTLDIQMNGAVFIPLKILNEVRREALDSLKEEILKKKRREALHPKKVTEKVCNGTVEQFSFSVSCENIETAKQLCRNEKIQGLYLNYDAMKECFQEGRQHGLDLYLMLPHMLRSEIPQFILDDMKYWISSGLKGFLVRNLEEYAILKREGLAEYCVLDHSMYTWNNKAVAFWRQEQVMRTTIPLELNEGEIRHRDNSQSELLIYGYLPLMISAQCVKKNLSGCSHKQEIIRLVDRYDKTFPAYCCCSPWKTKTTNQQEPCYNIIYNSIPYGLPNEKKQVQTLGITSLRLSFTLETPEDSLKILHDFLETYQNDIAFPKRELTKGHFKRGAE